MKGRRWPGEEAGVPADLCSHVRVLTEHLSVGLEEPGGVGAGTRSLHQTLPESLMGLFVCLRTCRHVHAAAHAGTRRHTPAACVCLPSVSMSTHTSVCVYTSVHTCGQPLHARFLVPVLLGICTRLLMCVWLIGMYPCRAWVAGDGDHPPEGAGGTERG